MRFHVKWLLTAAFAALVAAPAFAQVLSGMMPLLENGLDAPFLLLNPGVQKEIKLTEEQKGKFRKIMTDSLEKYKGELSKARTDKDAKRFLETMRKSTQETSAGVAKAMPDILKPAQIKRLKQIEIQANGLLSLAKPDVQKQLDLTSKQKDDIKRIGDGLKQDIAEVVKAAGVDKSQRPLEKARKMAETARKVKDLSEAANKKAFATFTDEQKKTWKEMTGEKFELKLDLLPRPGGRP